MPDSDWIEEGLAWDWPGDRPPGLPNLSPGAGLHLGLPRDQKRDPGFRKFCARCSKTIQDKSTFIIDQQAGGNVR